MIQAASPGGSWREIEFDRSAAAALASALELPLPIGALLWQRGLRDEASARAFLVPSLLDLSAPEEIPDLEAAVERILAVAAGDGQICIYGDYDVDGISGTTILIEALRVLGISARHYIPHRIEEGYGLNIDALRRLRDDGVDLLVTVDGGSNDTEELALAREIGLEVIITDHHPVEGEWPEELVVHPGRDESSRDGAALCGAGVAYKLAWGLGRRASGGDRVSTPFRAFLEESLALAALGTVADVVPLVGENRAIVAHGIRAIARTPRPGLRALLEVCGIDARNLDASDIGFRLAPHINAAGRMGRADVAVELLLTRDDERARALAGELARLNRRRKAVEQGMLRECEEEWAAGGHPEGSGPLLFAREGWHSGVAGIVAARLVDRLQRPVFVLALDGEMGRGSARSVDSRPLTPLYARLREHALSVGGHACAGGVTVARPRLEAFRRAVETAVSGGSEEWPARTYHLSIPAEAATLGLARGLARLAPFGAGNPEPLVRVEGLEVARPPRLVGRREDHIQVRLQRGSQRIDGIWFGAAARAAELRVPGPLSVVGALGEDRFRGMTRLRLRIEEVLPGSSP